MAFSFRYSLEAAPEPSRDGSGVVRHSIWAVSSNDGGQTWANVPGRHKTVVVPADELQVVIDMVNGAAKVQAYKNLLVANVNTQAPVPIIGWSVAEMTALLEANAAADTAAVAANDYITITLNQIYPVTFNI